MREGIARVDEDAVDAVLTHPAGDRGTIASWLPTREMRESSEPMMPKSNLR